jgi:AcrR family transcriptional regulator/transcriptional regulator with XRE-family HTH domain
MTGSLRVEPDADPSTVAPIAFGAHIRAARLDRGLTLRELARLLGISPGMLSQIETDKAGVSAARLFRIASVLEVSFDGLLKSGNRPGPTVGEAARAASPDWRTFAPLGWDPVLTAALEAFVDVGYHGATVRDIARRCNLSVPGLYHYHRSKQDMLLAILDQTMADLLTRAAAARDSGATPAERFARLVECLALVHTYRREPAFIGASEMRSLEPANRNRIIAARNALQRLIDAEVEGAVADGSFATEHPHEAARAAVTMCTGLVQWYRPDGPRTPEQIAELYVEFALDLMLPRRRPGAGAAKVRKR